MKRTIVLSCALIAVAACSVIFGGPKSVPKKFIDSAKSGDVEAMNKLFSRKAVEITGSETINSNNKSFSDMLRRAQENRSYSMQSISEEREGDTAFVSFVYRADDNHDSIGLGFYLSKEDGGWKIDHIGSREREDLSKLLSRPSEAPTETITPPSSSDEPPPPPAKMPTPPHAPISGGVLNGKAISLPKPPYPPIAKAAHASGQVTVQVLVDESGTVQTANAVSGHPLLRAAAVAAAKQAKFPPTKLSGQPVKVIGILTYTFNAE